MRTVCIKTDEGVDTQFGTAGSGAIQPPEIDVPFEVWDVFLIVNEQDFMDEFHLSYEDCEVALEEEDGVLQGHRSLSRWKVVDYSDMPDVIRVNGRPAKAAIVATIEITGEPIAKRGAVYERMR